MPGAQGVAGAEGLHVVHRAVGRPGVVLVGEGLPSRLTGTDGSVVTVAGWPVPGAGA